MDLKKDIKWYLKYRNTIWNIIFFVVGVFGGNVDRIASWLPTLKTIDRPKIEKPVDKSADTSIMDIC